ncbi:MAG: GTP 3',8-cyclase MoaA [Verrucomicrobiota bacterium]|nr:GTP 3',8-cyclase MoaA [Verrucomicrobiota bacterium]
MEDRFGHRISYLRVSITDRCNERCTYCMPQELQEWLPRHDILTFEETIRLIRIASDLGVTKIRLTGGEPLTRRDVIKLFRQLPGLTNLRDIGLSTNGTLLTREVEPGPPDGRTRPAASLTMAQAVRACGFNSVNISLDTLDREEYARVTGRDLLPDAIAGIDAAIAAGFPQIKINCVLIRGRNQENLNELIDFAAERNLLLRFIELMPVSTTEVLSETNFLPVAEARRAIEAKFGALIPQPEFKTNGPASYYQIPGRNQRIGFIGAMTNLHFCESCNKLRLTCDGKLRPCLGSYLEFDIMKPLRNGASDDELRQFFLDVVERKPEQHDFRTTYQPGRKMVAIGG